MMFPVCEPVSCFIIQFYHKASPKLSQWYVTVGCEPQCHSFTSTKELRRVQWTLWMQHGLLARRLRSATSCSALTTSVIHLPTLRPVDTCIYWRVLGRPPHSPWTTVGDHGKAMWQTFELQRLQEMHTAPLPPSHQNAAQLPYALHISYSTHNVSREKYLTPPNTKHWIHPDTRAVSMVLSTGHVFRMLDDRIPKCLLYGQL